MPEHVGAFGLVAHRSRLACHALGIVPALPHVPVKGRGRQPSWRQFHQTAIGGLDAVFGDDFEDTLRREATALPVGRAALHCRDDLAPPLDLVGRHGARLAPIGAVCVLRPSLAAQQPVERGAADVVEFGGRCH